MVQDDIALGIIHDGDEEKGAVAKTSTSTERVHLDSQADSWDSRVTLDDSKFAAGDIKVRTHGDSTHTLNGGNKHGDEVSRQKNVNVKLHGFVGGGEVLQIYMYLSFIEGHRMLFEALCI